MSGSQELYNRLNDVGFRDCDWAQLCRDLGWNYAIGIACNTYITLPDGTSDRLDNWVPVNRNRYFQNVVLTRETKLQANVSVTWTTDEKGQPEMIAIITDQIACRARLGSCNGNFCQGLLVGPASRSSGKSVVNLMFLGL